MWQTHPVWGAVLHPLLGVEHVCCDFLKITDFGFSNIKPTCPGWRGCGELKEVLQLDRVNFRSKSMILREFKITGRVVAGINYRLLLFIRS